MHGFSSAACKYAIQKSLGIETTELRSVKRVYNSQAQLTVALLTYFSNLFSSSLSLQQLRLSPSAQRAERGGSSSRRSSSTTQRGESSTAFPATSSGGAVLAPAALSGTER